VKRRLLPSPAVAPPPLPIRRAAPQLRRATTADQELLYGVYASTRAEELKALAWPPEVMDAFLRQQFDAQERDYRRNYPDASFDLIIVDGQRVGRLYVHQRPGETRIIDIALLPESRRHGVGTRLVGEVLASARARGACVTIHVLRNNPALGWYQRLGFNLEEDGDPYLFLRWRPPGEVL